jgi:hypothetical protein
MDIVSHTSEPGFDTALSSLEGTALVKWRHHLVAVAPTCEQVQSNKSPSQLACRSGALTQDIGRNSPQVRGETVIDNGDQI